MKKRHSVPSVIKEASRRRPVLFNCDVAIAGSGLSSSFAAIAAARCGAKTVLVERFPLLGGNIGPGLLGNGGIFSDHPIFSIPGGWRGIPQEFYKRVKALQPRAGTRARYTEDAGIASYVLYKMCREAGVEILLSAYASDPIMSGKTVKGLYVECKGGRWAVPAKVVIDGTGDADIARRAGAPIVPYLELSRGQGIDPRYKTAAVPAGMIRDNFMKREYPTYFNSTQMPCLVANVDIKAYRRFLERPVRLSPADRKFAEANFSPRLKPFWPALCAEWRKGTLPVWKHFMPKIFIANWMVNLVDRFVDRGRGGVLGFVISANGAIDASDPRLISKLEGEMHARAFEGVEYLRKHVDGFEDAYLLTTSYFMGFKGGPHIAAEHTLTVEEMFAPMRFDDVLYRNVHESNHGGDPSGFDVPYRAILTRGVDGLLVCGRGAGYQRRGHDPTGMRARPSMMILGQVAGTAAAIAARGNAGTRRPDIRKIQRRLLADGMFLGENERLAELGLK